MCVISFGTFSPEPSLFHTANVILLMVLDSSRHVEHESRGTLHIHHWPLGGAMLLKVPCCIIPILRSAFFMMGHWSGAASHYYHYYHKEKRIALCFQPAAKTFLLKLELCCAFHVFGRRPKQGSSLGERHELLALAAATKL